MPIGPEMRDNARTFMICTSGMWNVGAQQPKHGALVVRQRGLNKVSGSTIDDTQTGHQVGGWTNTNLGRNQIYDLLGHYRCPAGWDGNLSPNLPELYPAF
jgi:hypothetical protein